MNYFPSHWSLPQQFLFHCAACLLNHFSHVWLFVNLRAIARQVPLSMEFSRQEYWSRLPFLSPGDLPSPGIEPDTLSSAALAADCLPLYYLGRQTFLKYKIDHILLCSAFSKVFPWFKHHLRILPRIEKPRLIFLLHFLKPLAPCHGSNSSYFIWYNNVPFHSISSQFLSASFHSDPVLKSFH